MDHGMTTDELSGIVAGDPRADGTTMGPLASQNQLKSVREGIDRFAGSLTTVMGGSAPVHDKGWFVAPTLFEAASADVDVVHEHEVFGPVATLLPYDGSPEEAARLVARGDGSLVTSLYTDDATWMERAVLGLAPWNGRVWIGTAKCAEQTMPPGTVLANMIHGGPGRAGGGEELGGERGLHFYMQRSAIQGFKGHLDPAFGRPGEVTTA
ncbi:MAG: aldehyde dehydrogenase family protein [Planctomycetota bacterium]